MTEELGDSVEASRAVVYLEGDCDLYSAPKLKVSLLKKLDDGVRHILIDMSGLNYLDSTGVGVIISVLQAVKRSGGDIRFQGLRGSPRRLLERTSILPLMRDAIDNSLVGALED
jgi:anti-sigma B factor antagonist